jgi:hypothetical protein
MAMPLQPCCEREIADQALQVQIFIESTSSHNYFPPTVMANSVDWFVIYKTLLATMGVL